MYKKERLNRFLSKIGEGEVVNVDFSQKEVIKYQEEDLRQASMGLSHYFFYAAKTLEEIAQGHVGEMDTVQRNELGKRLDEIHQFIGESGLNAHLEELESYLGE